MAASSVRRVLATKSNSLLHSSQHSLSFSSSSSSTNSVAPPFRSFRSAQSIIVSLSDPNKIADVILSQSSFPAFTRYRPIYPYAIRKLARANRCDLIEHIVEDHLSKEKVSEGFTSASSCFTLKLAYNLKSRAFCEEGKVDLAEELLERKMEKEFGVSPDIHSYNVLLGAYLKGKDWVKFDELLKEVLRRNLEGNVTTYKHMIVRLCKDKECARAKKLLDEMVAKGVKPNAACYNWIIYGLCRVGDLESAKMVLERMINDGYVMPSSLTYYTLFRHMVQEGEFLFALDTCKLILKRKWVPPFEAMEGLVKGMLEMSKKKEACKVVKKMKKRLQGPAVDSWVKIEAAFPW